MDTVCKECNMKLKKYADELPKTLVELKSMSADKLTELWAHYFPGGRPQIKPLWWKIQCEIGGQKLEQKHITKLNAYAKNPDACVENSNKAKYHIKPGTQLRKKFKGQEHFVTVDAPNQFVYGGAVYKSLSAIATQICGHKVSGYDFFGFNNKGAKL